MIAHRFDSHTQTQRPAQQQPPIVININIPERITEVLMQLVATFHQQQLFPSSNTTDHDTAEPIGQRRQPSRENQPAAIRPAIGETSAAATVKPATDSGPADNSESLLAYYQANLKDKRKRKASRSTIADHETSLKTFDQFWKASQTLHRFSTPVQCLRQPDVLRHFFENLIDNDLSPITVNRRLTHVVMVAKDLEIKIEKPAPDEVKRYAKNRKPAGQQSTNQPTNQPTDQPTDQPKEAKPTKQAEDLRRIPAFAEIDAMARHVSVARYPYGDHAPYFWRGWIRFLAFIGPRSRDIVSPVPRKTGLLKADVIFDARCPIADVNNALGYELLSPHGWMWYTIGKDHHSDCRRILFPMPKWMRDWIRFFCELSSDPLRVFPSCQSRSKCLAQQPLTAAWNAIVKAANVDQRLVPSEGTGGRIALRKFASNWWHLATLKAKSDSSLADKMSHYVLHHAEVTTANKHYLNVQAAVLPTMLELMPTWPLPAADAKPVSLLPE